MSHSIHILRGHFLALSAAKGWISPHVHPAWCYLSHRLHQFCVVTACALSVFLTNINCVKLSLFSHDHQAISRNPGFPPI